MFTAREQREGGRQKERERTGSSMHSYMREIPRESARARARESDCESMRARERQSANIVCMHAHTPPETETETVNIVCMHAQTQRHRHRQRE